MSDENVRLYEGLFLINPAAIGSNLGTAQQLVTEALDRAGAKIEAIHRWDERRLAYDIKGVKRGLYMLAYFHIEGPKVAVIERHVNLSDNILRCMILRAEHIGETELQLAKEEQAKTQNAARLEGEGESAEAEAEKQTAEA